jgi:protein SPA2
MKSVINSVTSIIEDVRSFERRPQRDRSDVDLDALRSLRERADATLSNLVAASKTHATSSGMSPVSLLDAAASHVSATVTEIGRTLCIRKATKAEQDQFSPMLYSSSATATNGFSPSLRSVEEARPSHQRKGSAASRGRFSETVLGSSPIRPYGDSKRRPPSENSSEQTNSPPPIFDHSTYSGGVLSDDSVQPDGAEDAWTELKVSKMLSLAFSPAQFTLYIVALSGGADGIYRLRHTKRLVRSTQSNTFANTKRKFNTNHHDRVQHRRCMQ